MTRTQQFKRRIREYAVNELLRKSTFGIRDDAGVIEHILGSGNYRKVLEIGTYRGVTAAFMASMVEKVTTIDLKSGKMEWDSQVFNRERMWGAMGASNIDLRLVESNDEKAKIIAALDFDFAFVDGDHSFEGVKTDFELVRKCGAVLFHDYDMGTGIEQFVRTLPKSEVTIMDIFAFWRCQKK